MKFFTAFVVLFVIFLSKSYATNNAIIANPHVAIVKTKSGNLQGFLHNGIFSYRGIPYAKANRFQPPKEIDKWNGIRLAINYGDICPQNTVNSLDNFMFSGPSLKQSEDCLNLNIWTPSISDKKNEP